MISDAKKKREPRFHGEVSEKSHRNMSNIKGKDTSIEITLRKALWSKGYRYRKNLQGFPGRPDIALTKYKIAIFCDSEFFHERNMERDKEKDDELLFAGWTVVHFWGKDILKNPDECVKVIEEIIFEQKIQENEIYD